MSSDSLEAFWEQFMNSTSGDSPRFLPFLLGFSMSSRTQQSRTSDQQAVETEQGQGPTISFNMIVINNNSDGRSLEELISELGGSKEGLKPATKDSIQSMPKVVITEENNDKECSICLDGWEIGGEAREMPCKHMYHGECIEKWLGMHGSCPVCRYHMPLDDTPRKPSSDGNGGEELQGRSGERRIMLSFGSFGDRVDTRSDDMMDID